MFPASIVFPRVLLQSFGKYWRCLQIALRPISCAPVLTCTSMCSGETSILASFHRTEILSAHPAYTFPPELHSCTKLHSRSSKRKRHQYRWPPTTFGYPSGAGDLCIRHTPPLRHEKESKNNLRYGVSISRVEIRTCNTWAGIQNPGELSRAAAASRRQSPHSHALQVDVLVRYSGMQNNQRITA